MAIKNYFCEKCDHQFVCNKIKVLEKFDDESKSFIHINITMDACIDFSNTNSDKED